MATVTLVITMKKEKGKVSFKFQESLFFITFNIAENSNIHDYPGEANFRKMSIWRLKCQRLLTDYINNLRSIARLIISII